MPPSTASISLPRRYRATAHLGTGGMSSVWAAEDTVLGRYVAIKLLSPALATDGVALRRFQREARAAARLSTHPNVVTIYDVGEHEGQAFIVMEYFSGGSVAQAMRNGPVPVDQAIEWLRGVAAGLDAAHESDVVHRDIKPANLLLDERRRVAIADFGIARLAYDQQVTTTGQVLGTASYLSPEQALGDPATPASDRYALAVVAFELLVGERPFAAEHFAAQARQHVEAAPPVPSSRSRRVPAAVDAPLLRGLAKEPAERWPTCTAMVEAIAAGLSVAGPDGEEPPTEPTRALPGPGRGAGAGAAAGAAAAGAAEAAARRSGGDASGTGPAEAAARRSGGDASGAGPAGPGAVAPARRDDALHDEQRGGGARSGAATASAGARDAVRPRREPRAPTPPPAPPGRGRDGAPGRRRALLAFFALLGVIALVGLAISFGGGDDGGGSDRPQPRAQERPRTTERPREEPRQEQGSEPAPAAPTPTAEEPAPETETRTDPAPSGDDVQPSGDPAALNDQGFALMNQGRYEEAIPLLQQAVASFPEGTDQRCAANPTGDCLTFAYALFNLGSSLRQAGRPAEAIPILERRLAIDNQRGTVQAELDAARADAAGGRPQARRGDGNGRRNENGRRGGSGKRGGDDRDED